MIEWDIRQVFPRFLLNDRDGYAICKASEAMIRYAQKKIDEGLAILMDVDAMPEWRLDQMAWETNCLYDYRAPVEAKREWVRNALPLYRMWGTKAAIVEYLKGYFDNVKVEEWWEYKGEPYHFRVTVEGVWTGDKELWTRKAIETAKNVRSVLERLGVGAGCTIGIACKAGITGYIYTVVTGDDTLTGTLPQENIVTGQDKVNIGVAVEIDGRAFPYALAGTAPDANTIAAGGAVNIAAAAKAQSIAFAYGMTGAETAGTQPQANIVAGEAVAAVTTQTKVDQTTFPYSMAGVAETGTLPQENTVGSGGDATIRASPVVTATVIVYPLCGEET